MSASAIVKYVEAAAAWVRNKVLASVLVKYLPSPMLAKSDCSTKVHQGLHAPAK